MKNGVFCGVRMRHWANSSRRFEGSQYLHLQSQEGQALVRALLNSINTQLLSFETSENLPSDTSHPRNPLSSTSHWATLCFLGTEYTKFDQRERERERESSSSGTQQNLSQCHFAHKSYMDWPGIAPELSRRQVGHKRTNKKSTILLHPLLNREPPKLKLQKTWAF